MEFQLSCFKSWKMMLWKSHTQYASKFGKLSSGHRTGKGQFSFQSQRKAMPKNAQTTAQLRSSHILVKLCSKFSKWDFNFTWTLNFQMFKLDLKKAEEPEKLVTSVLSTVTYVMFTRALWTSSISILLPNLRKLKHRIIKQCDWGFMEYDSFFFFFSFWNHGFLTPESEHYGVLSLSYVSWEFHFTLFHQIYSIKKITSTEQRN